MRLPFKIVAREASSRLSATYSSGIRSTFRCSASTAARVAGPMAQILARSAAGRRASGPGASTKYRTPLTLVKISQS